MDRYLVMSEKWRNFAAVKFMAIKFEAYEEVL